MIEAKKVFISIAQIRRYEYLTHKEIPVSNTLLGKMLESGIVKLDTSNNACWHLFQLGQGVSTREKKNYCSFVFF